MEKKINSKKIVIKGLCLFTMSGILYYLGVRKGVQMGGQLFSDSLEMLGRTGITVTKKIDGEKYILSVTKK